MTSLKVHDSGNTVLSSYLLGLLPLLNIRLKSSYFPTPKNLTFTGCGKEVEIYEYKGQVAKSSLTVLPRYAASSDVPSPSQVNESLTS